MTKPQQLDPDGIPYDHGSTHADGVGHYSLDHPLGGGRGPAFWTTNFCHNQACGHHLAYQCLGCGACTQHDSCRCANQDMT